MSVGLGCNGLGKSAVLIFVAILIWRHSVLYFPAKSIEVSGILDRIVSASVVHVSQEVLDSVSSEFELVEVPVAEIVASEPTTVSEVDDKPDSRSSSEIKHTAQTGVVLYPQVEARP